jgi:hypothetical protein
LLLALVGLLGAAVFGDLERNRQTLDRWRADPEHYARLQRDLRDFYALPPQIQARIRKLDRELNALDEPMRRRLFGVMERYAQWLEHLPQEQRERLAAAPLSERLQLIRDLRDQQFLDRLPKKLSEPLKAMPLDKWRKEVRKLRQEEQRNEQQWRFQSRQQFQPLPPPKPK